MSEPLDLDAIEADFVKWSEEPFDDMGMAGFGAKYGAALIAEVRRLRVLLQIDIEDLVEQADLAPTPDTN